jgi:hypothetical protein
MQTDPIIITHLTTILHSFRQTGVVSKNLFPNILTKPDYYRVFDSQHQIGWTQFQDGLLSKSWAILQDKHYKFIGSRRSGTSWASELITQLWQLNHKTWLTRNDILHHTENVLNKLNGQAILIEAVIYELHRGKDELHENYSPFFSFFHPENITHEDTEKLKQWFKVIRTARENRNADRIDDFSSNGYLRTWIGLSKR